MLHLNIEKAVSIVSESGFERYCKEQMIKTMLNHKFLFLNCSVFKCMYKFNNHVSRAFISTTSQNRLQRNFCESAKILPTVGLAYISFESTVPDAEEIARPPVIVMHGLLGSKNNWKSLSKRLHNNLKRKIIVVDARNHGDSPHTDEFSYQHMADDVHNFMKEMDIPKATVLGHSMGGRVMMLLALKYPEIVHSLIVVDISPIRISSDIGEMTDYFDAMISVDLNMKETMSTARKMVDNKLAEYIKDPYVRQFLLMNLVQVAGSDSLYKWKVNLKSIGKHFQYIMQFIVPEGSSYSGPALFIGGKKSKYLTPSDEPNIVKLFPNAGFEYIEDAGHWVHSDKPEEFLSTVCKFIGTVAK